jgi:hypothetical protein
MICSSAEFVMDGMYLCGIDGSICYYPETPCGDDDYDEDDWEDNE